MPEAPPISALELQQGVFVIKFREPGDAILVDRTRADPAWFTVADMTIATRPGEDLAQSVCRAALVYHRRLRLAVSRLSVPPRENA
jgi:hypothetical protein